MRESWPNFSRDELCCSCCGKINPNPEFERLMNKVQGLRLVYGPMIVTSAYRCPEHPIEVAKDKPGQHSIAAIDIACSGASALHLIELALAAGFTGIGVNQKWKKSGRFVHLDLRDEPTIWSY